MHYLHLCCREPDQILSILSTGMSWLNAHNGPPSPRRTCNTTVQKHSLRSSLSIDVSMYAGTRELFSGGQRTQATCEAGANCMVFVAACIYIYASM